MSRLGVKSLVLSVVVVAVVVVVEVEIVAVLVEVVAAWREELIQVLSAADHISRPPVTKLPTSCLILHCSELHYIIRY